MTKEQREKILLEIANIDILFDAISVYQDKDLEYKKSLIQLIKF